MKNIEDIFREKASENSAYECLVTHWNVVKENASKVLSCVKMIFPHYTLHDESHSRAILENIQRVLGNDVVISLSVTDLWMLLCAAYYHDIGMFVDGTDIEKTFKDDSFFDYVEEIKNDASSALNKYAIIFERNNNKLNFKNDVKLDINSFNAARFLLADYMRKKHAKRSMNYVEENDNAMLLHNGLDRLVRFIANCCFLHYEDFEKVEKISKCENGVNGDDCHPMFIACMLRLGDLLDLDASRVSNVLLSHLYTSLPADSVIHNNNAMKCVSVSISSSEINVEIECDDCDSANEVDRLYTWIKDELNNQRNAWYSITSGIIANSLPMLGCLKITLTNGYDTLDNKYKPKFEIDAENAFKILQGSSIYSDKSQCMRELLQNAEDATYLRVFLENKEDLLDESVEIQDRYDKFLDYCRDEKYRIKVSICDINEECLICIHDSGIGMSKDDLRCLFKIGSGKRNLFKRDIIKQMPEFAKPSGAFGIGFQSVFLLTDEVYVETRRYDDGECINATLSSPLKKGFISIKTSSGRFHPYGTKIEFKLKNFGTRVNKSKIHNNFKKYYDELSNSFDFTKNDLLDAEIANIKDEICLFAEKSNISIELDGIKLNKEKKDKVKLLCRGKDIIAVSNFFPCDTQTLSPNYQTAVRYRNQIVRNPHFLPFIRFLRMDINILSGNADEILSLNRNELLEEYESKLFPIVVEELVKYIQSEFNARDSKFLTLFAMFVEYYDDKISEKRTELEKQWGKYLFSRAEKKINIATILKEKKSVKIIHSPSKRYLDINDKEVVVCGEIGDYEHFLVDVLIKKGYGYSFTSEPDEGTMRSGVYFFTPESQENWIDLKSWLYFQRFWKRRSLMPCVDYKKLTLKDDLRVIGSRDPMNIFEKISYPKTACPYISTGDYSEFKLEWRADDNFFEWVYKNRADEKVLLDEIKNEFERMKSDLEVVVDKINKKEAWDN